METPYPIATSRLKVGNLCCLKIDQADHGLFERGQIIAGIAE